MTYQVLARKWRPKSFREIVGQEHVTKSLSNALNQQRLHHAYLFTGTRGVGKTTLARILANCLNCEEGVKAEPCGKCDACKEIAEGRFIDLIEVDAASRTKVEDTRELLENVQYAPTKARYKIYLIDEVHMLSGHSFNALLKTLEEPPPHVKFLLATTDPHKVPITVLSRCLQFNLKNVSAEKIADHLAFILDQEKITYDKESLGLIANAANGSVRDALSLLDQAIAYSNSNVNTKDVNAMLGTVEQTYIKNLLLSLAGKKVEDLLAAIDSLAEQTGDFSNVLESLLLNLHQIALSQIAPVSYQHELANLFSAEEVQLYYQIALIGKRDLPLAPTLKSGFEMIMLRMLVFSLEEGSDEKPKNLNPNPVSASNTGNNSRNAGSLANLAADWHGILPNLQLSEATKALAAHCTIGNITGNNITLLLHPKHAPLMNDQHVKRLQQAFSEYFKQPLTVTFAMEKPGTTPQEAAEQKAAQKQILANNALEQDQQLQTLTQQFNAKIMAVETKDGR